MLPYGGRAFSILYHGTYSGAFHLHVLETGRAHRT